jgi:hypothetical protein
LFGSPATTFVDTNIDDWEETPQPADFNTNLGYTWSQLVGVFLNTPIGASDHIDNLIGNQAAWMFADPGVGLFQDYNSTDWQNFPPTHDFDAVYQPGQSYTLSLGIIGGGGNMIPGATFDISMYYRDASDNMVTIADTTITYTPAAFPSTNHMEEYSVTVPTVQPGDPWAGQYVGIQLASTVDTSMEGGYWDLNNVTVTDVPEPCSASLLAIGLGGGLMLMRRRRRGAVVS